MSESFTSMHQCLMIHNDRTAAPQMESGIIRSICYAPKNIPTWD